MTPARTEKTKFKLWAYVKALLKSITLPPRIFKITTGGKSFRVQASGLFIGNVQDLGIGREVDFDLLSDGYLDLHVVNPTNFQEYVGLGFRYAGGNQTEHNPEYVLKIKEALIELVPRKGVRSTFQKMAYKLGCFLTRSDLGDPSRADQLPCMIDGEEAGFTPMRLTVLPQAVNVWVPTVQNEAEPVDDDKHLEVA